MLKKLREAMMNLLSSKAAIRRRSVWKRVVFLLLFGWGNAERSIPSEERNKGQDSEVE